MDIEGLLEETTMGQVQRHLPVRDDGCRRVRAPEEQRASSGGCPSLPEPEDQDAEHDPGGEWQTAWLLTGLADPLQLRRDWAGSKEEMSIVSGYVKALTDLKKRMKEISASSGQGDDDPDDHAASNRK